MRNLLIGWLILLGHLVWTKYSHQTSLGEFSKLRDLNRTAGPSNVHGTKQASKADAWAYEPLKLQDAWLGKPWSQGKDS